MPLGTIVFTPNHNKAEPEPVEPDSRAKPVYAVEPPAVRERSTIEKWADRLPLLLGALGVILGSLSGLASAETSFGATVLRCAGGALLVGGFLYWVGVLMSMATSFLLIFGRPLAVSLGFIGVVVLVTAVGWKVFIA